MSLNWRLPQICCAAIVVLFTAGCAGNLPKINEIGIAYDGVSVTIAQTPQGFKVGLGIR